MVKLSEEPITVSFDVFKDETQLREVIDIFDTRFFSSASIIGGYTKNFIRETWNRVDWIGVFSRWWIRYQNGSKNLSFDEFMKYIDPEEEFYKRD